jgi:hypothetical protein
MIELKFEETGKTTIEKCVRCSRIATGDNTEQRSYGNVLLNKYGSAEIVCQCGEKYGVPYRVTPKADGEMMIRFADYNKTSFHRMI